MFPKAGRIAGLFFIIGPAAALGTTFGPIQVVDQAKNAPYAVRGRVEGASWVKPEPRSNQPYTYWKLRVTEQLVGEALPGELEVREPGGELGDRGYRVAGTAEFANGEDTYVFLRDTEESAKEIVGLASGKYTVRAGANGQPVVESGLGLVVMGEDGVAFTPEKFSALLKRVAKNETTEKDRSVFVNRHPMHEHENTSQEAAVDPKLVAQILGRQPSAASATETRAQTSPAAKTGNSSQDKANGVQETPPLAEEPSTGSSATGWILALGFGLAFLVAMVLFLRR